MVVLLPLNMAPRLRANWDLLGVSTVSVKRTSLFFAFALMASLACASVSHAQDTQTLGRVGTELARFNKPGALYGYLKSNHPKFFAIADAVNLAGVLDGSVDAKTFDAAFKAALMKAGLPAAESKVIKAELATFSNVLETLNQQRSKPRLGLSAAEVKKGDVVPELRKNLFDADKSWLKEIWSPDKFKTVEVKFIPGKVIWFNPNISVPELGIRAGVPLTETQKEAVAKIFSFQTAPGDPKAEGTAATPEYVGRALNPNSHVLTIINDKGEVISDLVAKGGGPNVANSSRDGRLDASEALMDSELSRNLGRAGVKNYDALVVIQPDGLDGKSITIRAPRSMLRHMDMDKLNDADLKKTLERVTNEVAIREGLPSLSISEWLRDYLPRTSGRNWGLLSGLGVEHGSDYTRDNHALAETVDWGWVKLHDHGNDTDQAKGEWDNIEKTINRVNQILSDAEKVVADQAKAVFDAAFKEGVEKGKVEKIRFDPKVLDGMSVSDLRTLAGGTKDPANPDKTLDYSASKEELIERMKKSGHAVDVFEYTRLLGLPVAQLEAIAKANGIPVPPAADRAALIASITGKPAETVRPELKARTAGFRPSETAGLSSSLRDLINSRTTTRDRVRVR